MSEKLDSIAVEKFVSYLKIKTVHPTPDYQSAVIFLKKYAEEIGLIFSVVEVYKDSPVVILTWKGTKDGTVGTILLNSHTDVVPVEEEKWSSPPFEAKIVNGRIYARGSQDMKIIGIQYMEAIRRLKSSGFVPERTVHLTFVPDEEIPGPLGMALFVHCKEFKDLNVAFALDEGVPSITDEVKVYYCDRSPWWMKVKCRGTPGHGSLLKSDTAGEKLWRFADKIMKFREGQKQKFEWSHAEDQLMGEYISVNWNMVNGGQQVNVIPSEMTAMFDIRIPPTIDLNVFENQLKTWCREAATASGGSPDSIELSFVYQGMSQAKCDVSKEPAKRFWASFEAAVSKFPIKSKLAISAVATDCHIIRCLGIPALGFSPLPHTPVLLHDHDEYVDKSIFLQGIQVYEEVIRGITAV